MERDFQTAYPGVRVPNILKIGGWIGGDRDGNPFVSAETLRFAFRRHADAVFRFLPQRTRQLYRELPLSIRRVKVNDDEWHSAQSPMKKSPAPENPTAAPSPTSWPAPWAKSALTRFGHGLQFGFLKPSRHGRRVPQRPENCKTLTPRKRQPTAGRRPSGRHYPQRVRVRLPHDAARPAPTTRRQTRRCSCRAFPTRRLGRLQQPERRAKTAALLRELSHNARCTARSSYSAYIPPRTGDFSTEARKIKDEFGEDAVTQSIISTANNPATCSPWHCC